MAVPPIPPDLLRRYLAGAALLPQEQAALQAYLAAGGDGQLEVLVEAELTSALGGERLPAAPYKAQLMARLRQPRSPLALRQWWWVAASLVLLVGVLIGWLAGVRTGQPALQQPLTEVSTRPGQRMQLTLPDGSVVTLNSSSRLTYPVAFTDSLRVVELSGEGYFSVQANPHQPFVVRSGALETRVLGTEFAVLAYPAEGLHRVAVAEGKVAVRAGQVHDVLTPGQGVELDSTGLRRVVAPTSAFAWQSGELDFRSQTLAEVARALHHYYGVPVRVAPAVQNRVVTAHFHHTSLPEVLASLAELHGLAVSGDIQTGFALDQP